MRLELQVAGFDITMDDRWLLAVQEGERIGYLVCPDQHIGLFEEELFTACLQQQRTEIISRNVIHHQIVTRTAREEVRDLG
jgi:hypothetical protein